MIVEMWGTCDGFNITFRNVGPGLWETTVPADLADGTYIVEIWARSNTGYVIYTTAVLYVCDSRAVELRPVEDAQIVKIYVAEYRVEPVGALVSVRPSEYTVRLLAESVGVKPDVIRVELRDELISVLSGLQVKLLDDEAKVRVWN